MELGITITGVPAVLPGRPGVEDAEMQTEPSADLTALSVASESSSSDPSTEYDKRYPTICEMREFMSMP